MPYESVTTFLSNLRLDLELVRLINSKSSKTWINEEC